MHVCMYACTHVCMYACMHVCMYACTHVRMYACMHVCINACMHVCMYACMHLCIYASMHVCMYACMHVCMYACMHSCMHACMHVCMYVRTYCQTLLVCWKTQGAFWNMLPGLASPFFPRSFLKQRRAGWGAFATAGKDKTTEQGSCLGQGIPGILRLRFTLVAEPL